VVLGQPSAVTVTWKKVHLSESYQVKLYRESLNSRTELASYNMKFSEFQPAISFRNLDENVMYSVQVQAISADNVSSHSAKVTFKAGM